MSVRRTAPLSLRPSLSNGLVSGGAILLVGAIVAAGGVTPASAAELPTVTLTVDGDSTTVSTGAATVDAVLGEQAVVTDDNDLVSPAPSTTVSDGMNIDVVTRIAVRVKEQDSVTSHFVAADTVGELMSELALPTRVDTAADVPAAPTADAVAWTQTTVESPNGQRLTTADALVNGSVARVQRVRVVTDGRRQIVKARTVHKHSPLVHSGTTKLMQRGHSGRRHVTLRTTRIDGTVVRRKVLDRNVLRNSRPRVVAIGTGPNWPALARCESGNNPHAVNPAGFYGLYQFSMSTWQAVGGSGNPAYASRWEQTKRAWILYRGSGRSPWPVCGANL